MKRKTDSGETIIEAVSYIFHTGYFGRSEYAVPYEMQLSIGEPESAFGNRDGFNDENYYMNLGMLPCFAGMDEHTVRDILSRRRFQIACGKLDVSLAALESVYALRQKYGIRKFLMLTYDAAERERLTRTFSVMRDYFSDKYYGLNLDITTYDSENLRALRGFALSDNIQLLIVNKEFFIRSNNIMLRPVSSLEGTSPISIIRPARCVALTISEKISDAAAILRHTDIFDPLCTISFTASDESVSDVIPINPNYISSAMSDNSTSSYIIEGNDLQLNI